MKIGLNDLCPCGSNKKYKKCYKADSLNCTLYKKEYAHVEVAQHNKREAAVSKSIIEFTQELNNLFYKTKEGLYPTSLRMQLIGCFSIIDVLANYWFEYLGRKDGTPSLRFKEYVNKFCFINKNDFYKNSLEKISIDNFYLLRCGLVHFFGLSIPNIMIMTDMPDVNLDDYRDKFKKVRKDLILISPNEIKSMIVKSAELMLLGMIDTIQESQTNENSKQKHIQGILRIHEKMQKEGAVLISKEKIDEVGEKIKWA